MLFTKIQMISRYKAVLQVDEIACDAITHEVSIPVYGALTMKSTSWLTVNHQ